jgi:hypothetical protein
MKRGILVLAALFTLGFGRDGRAEYDVNSQESLDMMMAGAQAGAQQGGYFTSFVAPPSSLPETEAGKLEYRDLWCSVHKTRSRQEKDEDRRTEDDGNWLLDSYNVLELEAISGVIFFQETGAVNHVACSYRCTMTAGTRPNGSCPTGYRWEVDQAQPCKRASFTTKGFLNLQNNLPTISTPEEALELCNARKDVRRFLIERSCQNSAGSGMLHYDPTPPSTRARCVPVSDGAIDFDDDELFDTADGADNGGLDDRDSL